MPHTPRAAAVCSRLSVHSCLSQDWTSWKPLARRWPDPRAGVGREVNKTQCAFTASQLRTFPVGWRERVLTRMLLLGVLPPAEIRKAALAAITPNLRLTPALCQWLLKNNISISPTKVSSKNKIGIWNHCLFCEHLDNSYFTVGYWCLLEVQY